MNDPRGTSKGLQEDGFEEWLRRSLKRVDAPEDFAARVLERAAASDNISRLRPRFRHARHRRWIGAVAATLLLAAVLANQVRVRRERARVAHIRAQFDTAMRVTDGALEQTKLELIRAGVNFGE